MQFLPMAFEKNGTVEAISSLSLSLFSVVFVQKGMVNRFISILQNAFHAKSKRVFFRIVKNVWNAFATPWRNVQ